MTSRLVCLVILLVPTCLSQSLPGQCPEVTSACGVTTTSSLHERLIQSSIPAADVNGSLLITRDVIISHMTNNFDLNTDGCLTQTEWNQTHNPSVLITNDYSWLVSQASLCDSGSGVNISSLLASNLDFSETPENFNIHQPLVILSRTCEASPDLYSTDCDCAQLPAACRDPALSSNTVCASYNAQVADRLSQCIFNPPGAEVLAARTVCGDITQLTDSPMMQVLCAIFSLQETQHQNRLNRQAERPDRHGSRGRGQGRHSEDESNERKDENSDDSDDKESKSRKRNHKRKFLLSRYF